MRVRMAVALGLLAVPGLGAAAPDADRTLCEGSPSAGTLHSGRRLESRPYLRIKAASQLNAWGHPMMLQLLSRGARAAAQAGSGSMALIGDLSARDGGPLPGHVSHQAGRDADVGFFVSDSQGRPILLDAFEAFGADGHSLSVPEHYFDGYRNWVMLRAWFTDLRVVISHIFISSALRQLLLEYGQQSPEFQRYVPLASQVLHAYPNHADHFHVRIACPSDQGPACHDRGSSDE